MPHIDVLSGPQVSRIMAMPVFHAAAVPSTHFSALKIGMITYMMRRFDLEQFLINIEKFNVTDLTVVPPMAIAIIMSPLTQKRNFLKRVKWAACGAAPLDKQTQARFHSLLNEEVPFTQAWGMTELTCTGAIFPYTEHDDTGSVGRLIPNLEAKSVSILSANKISP